MFLQSFIKSCAPLLNMISLITTPRLSFASARAPAYKSLRLQVAYAYCDSKSMGENLTTHFLMSPSAAMPHACCRETRICMTKISSPPCYMPGLVSPFTKLGGGRSHLRSVKERQRYVL